MYFEDDQDTQPIEVPVQPSDNRQVVASALQEIAGKVMETAGWHITHPGRLAVLLTLITAAVIGAAIHSSRTDYAQAYEDNLKKTLSGQHISLGDVAVEAQLMTRDVLAGGTIPFSTDFRVMTSGDNLEVTTNMNNDPEHRLWATRMGHFGQELDDPAKIPGAILQSYSNIGLVSVQEWRQWNSPNLVAPGAFADADCTMIVTDTFSQDADSTRVTRAAKGYCGKTLEIEATVTTTKGADCTVNTNTRGLTPATLQLLCTGLGNQPFDPREGNWN